MPCDILVQYALPNIPLKADEAAQILRYMGMEEVKPKVIFELGEWVRITSGPFQGLDASVQDINNDKGKVKVMASMFGRETLVELDFGQVQKLD